MAKVELDSKFELGDRVIMRRLAENPAYGKVVEIRSKLYRSINTMGDYREVKSHEYGIQLDHGSFGIFDEECIVKEG